MPWRRHHQRPRRQRAATPTMRIRLRLPRRPVTCSPTRAARCAAGSPAAEADRAARRRCWADGNAGGGDGSGRIGRAERDDALSNGERCGCPAPGGGVHGAGVDGHGVGDRAASSRPDDGHRRGGNRSHLAGGSCSEATEAAAAESAGRRAGNPPDGAPLGKAPDGAPLGAAEPFSPPKPPLHVPLTGLGDHHGRGGESRDPGWRARRRGRGARRR